MDFQLSEDQQALRAGIRSFCDGRVSIDALRELEKGFDRSLWGELAEMGVFSLRLAESAGGVGLGSADAVIVFAELGRRLVPGPLVWSHLAADLVDGAAAGESVVGGIEQLRPGNDAVLVEHLDSLDALLVLRKDGVYRVDPKSVSARSAGTPLDPFTPIFEVSSLPQGERVGDAALVSKLRVEGAALAAGQLLGIAEMTQELATDYAKKREQFDRPIGSFQAVSSRLADGYIDIKGLRLTLTQAAWRLSEDLPADVDVSTAAFWAADAGHRVAHTTVHVHGGVGIDTDHPVHRYFLAAKQTEFAIGNATGQLLRIGRELADTPA